MADRFPEVLEIEVDRDVLRAYLRAKWLLPWVGVTLFFGVIIGFMVVGPLDNRSFSGASEVFLVLAEGIGVGLLASAVISTAAYFLFVHRFAARAAAGLHVSVEGAFLRIRQDEWHMKVDRKLHFRSIVDYATVDDRLTRRFGTMILQMTTTGGGMQSTIRIAGLKDCPRVRDMLAEIDSMRENE